MNSRVSITLENATDKWAIISLGANQDSIYGSPALTLTEAIKRLQRLSTTPLVASSLYQTAAIDCPAGSADFINAVVALQPYSILVPLVLLGSLKSIENAFGRQRNSIANQPRSLDLDLICYANLRTEDEHLILPHPRAHLRRFVLEPLVEIAPEMVLPGQKLTVTQLLLELGEEQKVRRL